MVLKMKQSQLTKEAQILKMAIKIMERYEVLSFTLAISVATSLYENGIYLDKFQEKYYSADTAFYLDEIVLHLLKKQLTDSKIIKYQDYLTSKKERLLLEPQTNPYPTSHKNTTKHIKSKPKSRKKGFKPNFKCY